MTESRIDEIERANTRARQATDGVSQGQSAVTKMTTPETIERAIEQLRTRDPSLTKTEAMQRARLNWPNLLTAFQAESMEKARGALARADLQTRHDPAVVAFEELTDEIQDREKCSRFEATRKAVRTMGSTAFAKYCEAFK